MIINGYGVELIRLRHEHIELVRTMRNSESVKKYMEYRDEITPDMQEKWFASVNNRNNNYFLICVDGEKIGVIYGSQIDWNTRTTGNGGIFIWNENFIGSNIPMTASLLLLEINFLLGMQQTYVKILQDNDRAKQFNFSLGYRVLPGQENIANQQYVLDKDLFFSKTEKARALLATQHGDQFIVTMDHPEDDSESHLVNVYRSIPEENKKRIKLIVS
ncbi:MAG TPA: hypothetical protein VL651_14190 [Bacteroidia bacterium]|jgi:RimJ/RimL family protein N-acetyltransferase|nr:hypothetical protein [Bacteroidia bacterium]